MHGRLVPECAAGVSNETKSVSNETPIPNVEACLGVSEEAFREIALSWHWCVHYLILLFYRFNLIIYRGFLPAKL
jgi:hypothetical protein